MGKGPCLWSGGLAKPEFFIEDYDDVGDDDYDVDVIDDVCDVDAYGAEVQQNEVYDDVGDEYDNDEDEDEDCVDIDAVEARPELSVMSDDVDYDDVD